MASSSGTKNDGPPKSLSRRLTRMPTTVDALPEEELIDSELVPSSIAEISPILRVANEVEPDNPRVAYLCRFHAFEKAHKMDPMSAGRGVRQFKTYLLHRLEKEDVETRPQLAKTDPKEIQKYYQIFYERNIRDSHNQKPEEMAKIYQIASVLYDVLSTVVPDKIDEQIHYYAREVEMKKKQYVIYNILPLGATGAKHAIMKLPEIKAAISALSKVENFPKPRPLPDEPDIREIAIHDLLDWLWVAFRFQKGNVANQREHLILLLANADSRSRQKEEYVLLDTTVEDLMQKILKNYFSWCKYLHREHNVKTEDAAADRQQLQLLYIGLYLLIWGEASNVRFMPECICYIFHNMANELNKIWSNAHLVTGGTIQPAHQHKDTFLDEVVTPIYQVLRREAKRNQGGKASHSKWRNYDDINEYFWSDKCFELGWPMDRTADFFVHSDATQPRNERPNNVTAGKRKPKTNFVEVRTFWHLYRSFDRMWVYFILSFQAMVIVAWSAGGSLSALFDEDVLRKVMSIFVTYSILNLLQASLDIILSCRAWGSLKYTQIARYLLKFMLAAAWAVILPIGYYSFLQNPTGLVRFFSNWAGNWQSQSFFNFSVAIFMMPNILSAILFVLPPLRRQLERADSHVVVFIMWWAQPKLYVGRGMHEGLFSLLRYTLFWVLLLVSKFAFSYYVEILPLVQPTKLIMQLKVSTYVWHEFFPNARYNIGVVISIWAPIFLVYLMDPQIWYSIFSTIFGGINGAFSHLGEIRTLGMLRSRFDSVPGAFTERLVPLPNEGIKTNNLDESLERKNIAKFSQVWNEFINSMREEDLISNRERDLLLVPYSSSDISVVQWPPFLLASKIPIALDMAKDFKRKSDTDLFKKIKSDAYMHSAVIECYEAVRDILDGLLDDKEDKAIVTNICSELHTSIHDQKFLNEFRMSELPNLSSKLERLLVHLVTFLFKLSFSFIIKL